MGEDGEESGEHCIHCMDELAITLDEMKTIENLNRIRNLFSKNPSGCSVEMCSVRA